MRRAFFRLAMPGQSRIGDGSIHDFNAHRLGDPSGETALERDGRRVARDDLEAAAFGDEMHLVARAKSQGLAHRQGQG